MSISATTTIIGNITSAPDLRFTQGGKAVINFTVASTERYLDRSTGEWKDGSTVFMPCYSWNGAENIAESLSKGDRAIITGRLKQRSYTTDDGNKRQVVELEVDEVGPSLRYAQAKPIKAPRAGSTYAAQGADQWATAGA
ncbi:single-stranded DNA-binding protein [Catenulispora yoronensis]|uniref:Single-stranded DNA-binding protein n=1 Tax=Catenulispora yoronensis TaxID=450799 RepID=A0ABP5GLF5_9ACTN